MFLKASRKREFATLSALRRHSSGSPNALLTWPLVVTELGKVHLHLIKVLLPFFYERELLCEERGKDLLRLSDLLSILLLIQSEVGCRVAGQDPLYAILDGVYGVLQAFHLAC